MRKLSQLLLFVFTFLLVSCDEELGPIVDTPVDNVLEYSDLDNEFLAAMFKYKSRYYKNQYTVIAQNSCVGNISTNGLILSFQECKCEIRDMIKALFEKNKKATKFSIQTSVNDGYVVDYDRLIEKNFRQPGIGLRNWIRKNSEVQGFTKISLPVVGKNGLALIYYENFDSNGVGRYELYKFKDKQLKYLTSVVSFTAD